MLPVSHRDLSAPQQLAQNGFQTAAASAFPDSSDSSDQQYTYRAPIPPPFFSALQSSATSSAPRNQSDTQTSAADVVSLTSSTVSNPRMLSLTRLRTLFGMLVWNEGTPIAAGSQQGSCAIWCFDHRSAKPIEPRPTPAAAQPHCLHCMWCLS